MSYKEVNCPNCDGYGTTVTWLEDGTFDESTVCRKCGGSGLTFEEDTD